jgi:ParB family transcriptional regulator, chromosome partitioning protein
LLHHAIVAGVHRLEACKRLGWSEIPANVVEMPELRLQLAEIDENLAGPTLSKAERALFTRQRKELWELLYPETKHGGDHGNQYTGGKVASRKLCDLANSSENNEVDASSDRFTAETALATNQSERSVQLDAARGENILQEVLEVIPGSSLDSGVELDALMKLTPEQQRELAEKVSPPVEAHSGSSKRSHHRCLVRPRWCRG